MNQLEGRGGGSFNGLKKGLFTSGSEDMGRIFRTLLAAGWDFVGYNN